MTAQLATALKRSLGTALPVAILVAAAVAVQYLFPGNAAGKEALTAALGAAATVIPILTRGLVEGLSDGQRAALGSVVNSDVTATVVSTADANLEPIVRNLLAKAGVNVTEAQVAETVKAAEQDVKGIVAADTKPLPMEKAATVTHSTEPVAPAPETPLVPSPIGAIPVPPGYSVKA